MFFKRVSLSKGSPFTQNDEACINYSIVLYIACRILLGEKTSLALDTWLEDEQ